MRLTSIPVDSSKLQVGMYVVKLDRPWRETPFVFQGFTIKDKAEVRQLQAYCSQVFVEIERGEYTEEEIRKLSDSSNLIAQHTRLPAKHKVQATLMQRFMLRIGLGRLVNAVRPEQGPYSRTATVRKEAPTARVAYDNCVAAFRKIFKETKRTRAVDLEAVDQALKPVIDSILRNPDAMAWTVFSGKRSSKPYCRSVATAVWAVMFGRHLEFDRAGLRNLAIGGLLLDIGNVALPDELLHATGAIGQDEYDQVVRHVQAGIDILRKSRGVSPEVFEMLVYHHERYDGSGYPNQLRASDITPHGRIAGIIDCYDAMTTKSEYSPALAAYDAARELNEMRDKTFHAEVVEQFLKTIGMFPTGSIVELNDHSAGLVLEQNPANPLQPKVLLLKDSMGGVPAAKRIISADDWREHNIWIEKGHEHGAFGIDPAAHFS